MAKTIRNFHLFSSLIAAVFLLFFAVSGYLMNHRADWKLDDVEETTAETSVPADLLKPEAKERLVSWFLAHGARGHLADFERDEETLFLEFRSARQTYDAEIDLATGKASVDIQKASFLASLAEIHRGLTSGENTPSRFIDAMAALMGVVSFSGLVVFFRRATRGNKIALACFVGSLALAVAVYLKMM